MYEFIPAVASSTHTTKTKKCGARIPHAVLSEKDPSRLKWEPGRMQKYFCEACFLADAKGTRLLLFNHKFKA